MDPVTTMLSSENDAIMLSLCRSMGLPGLTLEMYTDIKTFMLENPGMENAFSASLATAEPGVSSSVHVGAAALTASLSAVNLCSAAVQSRLDAAEAAISAMEPNAVTEYQHDLLSKVMAACTAMGLVPAAISEVE